MKVRDIMTTDPISVRGDTLLKEAARIMVRHKVSGLPVIDDDGRLIGIVTEGDFLRREASRDRPYRHSLLDALFGDAEDVDPPVETVAQVMTDKVVTIAADAGLGEAARLMSTRNVRALIARFRDEGRCILISTHLMSEAQRLCDRVAIIHKGRLQTIGTPDDLIAQTDATDLEEAFVRIAGEERLRADLWEQKRKHHWYQFWKRLHDTRQERSDEHTDA